MILLIFLFLSAFLISSVSAFFSISGLTAIFPNALLPIVSLGIVLELGKLVTASFVYNYWQKHRVLARGILLGFTVVLSGLSSVGVYGYLMRTHIEGTQGISTGTDELGFVQKQIDIENNTVVFNQNALTQMDKMVNNYLSDSTKTNRAESSRIQQNKERQRTLDHIAKSNQTLLTLQRQKDSLSKLQRIREVDVGPLKYLAALFSSADSDAVLRWFVLVLVAVLDPLAILLVIAGNIHRKELSTNVTDPLQTANGIDPLPPEESWSAPVGVGIPQEEIQHSVKLEPKELDFRGPEKWGEPPKE